MTTKDKRYVIKTGEERKNVLCYHNGYAMLPSEVYVLTEKQANDVLNILKRQGIKYTKKEFKKGDYDDIINFETRECFDNHFKEFEMDVKNDNKERKIIERKIAKLMKDKKLVEMWKEEKEIFKIRDCLYNLKEEFNKEIIRKDERLSILFEFLETISSKALEIAKEKEEEILKYQNKKHNTHIMLGCTKEFRDKYEVEE